MNLIRKVSYILFIIFTINILLFAQDTKNEVFWLQYWRQFQSDVLLHPSLREAKFLYPGERDSIGTLNTSTITLVGKNNMPIGLLTTTDNIDQKILSYDLWPTYVEGAYSISVEKAVGIAREFLSKHYNKYIGIDYQILAPHQIDDSGIYEINFERYQDDIRMLTVSIKVNYAGFVTGASFSDPIASNGIDITKLAPSPGRNMVLAIMKTELQKKKIIYDDIESIKRYAGVRIPGNPIPIMCWNADVIYIKDGIKMRQRIMYDEGEKLCMLVNKAQQYREKFNFKIKQTCCDNHPIWTPDGKALWWQTNARWKGLQEWIDVLPSSLCYMENGIPLTYIYRPLADIGRLWIDYGLPSISPNGRWLSMKLSNKSLSFIDLKNNTFYLLDVECLIVNRVSWSSDNQQVVCVQNGDKYALLQNVFNDSGIPFADKSKRLQLGKPCRAIEFIPGTKDTLIAVLDENQLVSVKLQNDVALSIKNIVKFEALVERMHVMPDGKYIIVRDAKGATWKVDIGTGELKELKWLSGKLPDETDMSKIDLDWDISPDSKQIAFSAPGKDGMIEYIYTANIDGTNIKQITKGNPAELHDSYRPNGYRLVSEKNLTLKMLEKLGYVSPSFVWGVPGPLRVKEK